MIVWWRGNSSSVTTNLLCHLWPQKHDYLGVTDNRRSNNIKNFTAFQNRSSARHWRDSDQTVTQISSRQCLKGAGAGASDFSVDDSGSNRATVQHRGFASQRSSAFLVWNLRRNRHKLRGPKRLTKPKRKSNFDICNWSDNITRTSWINHSSINRMTIVKQMVYLLAQPTVIM